METGSNERTRRVAPVLLAAGGGTRWDGAGHKLAAPLEGTPVIEHAMRAAVESGLGTVIVVTGATTVHLPDDLAGRIELVDNPDWAEGQSTSLLRAVASASERLEQPRHLRHPHGCFQIHREHLREHRLERGRHRLRGGDVHVFSAQRQRLHHRLDERHRAHERGADAVVVGLGDQPRISPDAWRAVAASSSSLAVAVYGESRGHPVLIGRDHWNDLPNSGDLGARELLRRFDEQVEAIPCEGSALDVDTTEDLNQWQS
ncbi:MAG: nucleotidyltransferase family protein [Ilumatobacter sp.]